MKIAMLAPLSQRQMPRDVLEGSSIKISQDFMTMERKHVLFLTMVLLNGEGKARGRNLGQDVL